MGGFFSTACYIDIEHDEDEDEGTEKDHDDTEYGTSRGRNGAGDELANGQQSQWCDLPDHIMERIFAHLSIRERYYASLVRTKPTLPVLHVVGDIFRRNCLELMGRPLACASRDSRNLKKKTSHN